MPTRLPSARRAATIACLLLPLWTAAQDKDPADELPANIKRLTHFGERADWSHDGKRILFLSKTFGDAMEIDVMTGAVRNLTAHYPHHGYTRAQCALSVLDRRLNGPAKPLGTKCSEGPAVSRRRMHIAWTHVAAQYPDEMPAASSRIYEADIVYDRGTPKLGEKRLVLDSRDLPFRCTLEAQNFRPPDERELTFSAYGHQGTDVCGIDLGSKMVTNYS